MGDKILIRGYVGFCPELCQNEGHNFPDSTDNAVREKSSVQRRHKEKNWKDKKNGNVDYRDHEHASSYQSDGQKYKDGRCPLKAYPLSCSEYGSPCLDKRCDDGGKCCSNKQVIKAFICTAPCAENSRNSGGSKKKSSQMTPCCDSCSKGCRCAEDDRKTEFQQERRAKKSSKACCGSCSEGGSCEEDRKSESQQRTRKSKRACCDSCSEGGPCEDESSNSRFKYRAIAVIPFRQCGVIANYMGFIPGLQMTFGEPYGITANRLLERHFSEQEN